MSNERLEGPHHLYDRYDGADGKLDPTEFVKHAQEAYVSAESMGSEPGSAGQKRTGPMTAPQGFPCQRCISILGPRQQG